MPIVSPHRIPVIVGVADVIDRPADLARAREPATLMADALLAAFQDAAGPSAASLLTALDSLDIVAEHSWPYDQPCDVLAARTRSHAETLRLRGRGRGIAGSIHSRSGTTHRLG